LKKILFVIMIFINVLFANSLYNDYFKKIGDYYNIDYKILKTLAVIESSLSPNSINVNIKNNYQFYNLIKFLKKNHIKYKTYSKKMVYFNVNDNNYKNVLIFLNKNKYSFDIGIMQINNSHAKTLFKQELLLKNPFYNIYIGGKILRECFDKSNDAYQAISCYNSGSIYKIRKHYLKKFFDTYKFYVFK